MGRWNTWEDVLRRIHVTDYGCWLWMGERNSHGYGRVSWRAQRMLVHRLVYEQVVGPVPDGLVIDHLCRVTDCCNPAHLEPVTQQENMRRGDHSTNHRNRLKRECMHGHPLSGDNLYVTSTGNRQCKECKRQRKRMAA